MTTGWPAWTVSAARAGDAMARAAKAVAPAAGRPRASRRTKLMRSIRSVAVAYVCMVARELSGDCPFYPKRCLGASSTRKTTETVTAPQMGQGKHFELKLRVGGEQAPAVRRVELHAGPRVQVDRDHV